MSVNSCERYLYFFFSSWLSNITAAQSVSLYFYNIEFGPYSKTSEHPCCSPQIIMSLVGHGDESVATKTAKSKTQVLRPRPVIKQSCRPHSNFEEEIGRLFLTFHFCSQPACDVQPASWFLCGEISPDSERKPVKGAMLFFLPCRVAETS